MACPLQSALAEAGPGPAARPEVKMRAARWKHLLPIMLCGVLAGPATAQQPPPRPAAAAPSKEARAALDTGQKLAGLNEHGAALPHFYKALSLSSDPKILLLIARSERAVGKNVRAFTAAERFLQEAAPGPRSKERKEAEGMKAELGPRLARLVVKSTTEGATVLVDGEAVGKTPLLAPVLVDRGTHSVRVTKERHRPFERAGMAFSEDEVSLTAELEKEPPSLGEVLTGPAKEAYEAGKLLFGDGDYASALVKFRTAHELSASVEGGQRDARLLWNMAVCEKNLRHYARVLSLVERYLADGKDVTTQQDRKEAEELLKIVRAFVTPLLVIANEEGATVTVDDEVVGQTPMTRPVMVDVGSRKIKVTKAEFTDVLTQSAISGSETFSLKVNLIAIKHEGKLVVTAGPEDTITVDGKAVGQGHWEALLPSGTHAVLITGKNKRPHQTDVAILDNETRRVQVTLEAEATKSMTWLWAGGGVLAAAGLGVGAYFLLRPETTAAPPPVAGTMQPGTIQLPLRGLSGFRPGSGSFLAPSFGWRGL